MPARSDSSPRPRGEETRAHILAAAETLFAARGYVSVSTWVDYVWERPSTAQLLLRESGRQGQGSDALTRLARPFLELLHETFAEGRRQGVFQPITSDPIHFGSTIVGSTIFFVAGMPSFVSHLPLGPLSREQLEIHRRDTLRVARRLLGLHGPRPVRT
ncbi:MAG: hypothetical protein ABFS46_15180 [Myxococcota bacterium]